MIKSLFLRASELYEKSIQSGGIDNADMDTVVNWPTDQLSILFSCADQVRRHFFGDSVEPCTLMNIKSGGCSEDCAFCAQSSHNDASVTIQDLADTNEIKRRCEEAFENGVSFCVVSSGKRLSKPQINKITDALKDCGGEKHASLGILDQEDFLQLHDAGVVCYNHNLETSRSFFPNIVSTHTWDERVKTVKSAKEAGLKVCCGGILGLGESWEQRKEFCNQIKEIGADTVPLNFFNPVPGTRVAPSTESPLELLKVVALFRLAMPSKVIKVCGGREYHLGPLQSLIFLAGANGFVTGGYLTTPGAGVENDKKMIELLGLEKRGLR